MRSNNKDRVQKGFSLIELLVVFAVTGVVMASSMAGFYTYSNNQSFTTTVADVKQGVNLARSRAMSRVKPAICNAQALDGYQFWHPVNGTYFRLSVRCGGTYHILERKSLPANITFASGSSTTTFFRVGTGTTATTSNIILTGYGRTNTIRVETTGKISIQ